MIRRLSWGSLALPLIGFYLFLKIQGWYYGYRAQDVEDQLAQIRPRIAALVTAGQMKATRETYQELFEQIRQMDQGGERLLAQLSATTPASISLETLENRPMFGLSLRGRCTPQERDPELDLVLWAQKLLRSGYDLEIKELTPDAQLLGVWRFELEARRELNGRLKP